MFFFFRERRRVRVEQAAKNCQNSSFCISGALFLFYDTKFHQSLLIIFVFSKIRSLCPKIPHRSAGFLPASFLSMQVGARAHFRTRGSIGGRTVYLPSIHITGFFKIHSRHTAMLLRRWGRYFFVLLQISIFRFYTNIIHLHQVYQFLRRLLPRSYRLPPD